MLSRIRRVHFRTYSPRAHWCSSRHQLRCLIRITSGRWIITAGSTVSSSNRPSLVISKTSSSSSDFFGQTYHTRRLPHRSPEKKILGHGHQIVAVRGDRITTHFCFHDFYYYNTLTNRRSRYSQLGTYSLIA